MPNPGKSVYVFQHTDSEFLGLMEDHLEGRGIGFTYLRAHVAQSQQPFLLDQTDGVVLLGGGPWGSAGTRDLPTLDHEVLLTRQCLERDMPVIGIGLGSQILAIAAGGSSQPAPLRFTVGEARRIHDDALNGFLPERYPIAVYMRDHPAPPPFAEILAVDNADQPAVFRIGKNALGFTAHPGMKSAMVEDLVMEFEEAPENIAEGLEILRARQRSMEDALVGIMTGVVQVTGLMSPVP